MEYIVLREKYLPARAPPPTPYYNSYYKRSFKIKKEWGGGPWKSKKNKKSICIYLNERQTGDLMQNFYIKNEIPLFTSKMLDMDFFLLKENHNCKKAPFRFSKKNCSISSKNYFPK